jgi:hypothetical protein
MPFRPETREGFDAFLDETRRSVPDKLHGTFKNKILADRNQFTNRRIARYFMYGLDNQEGFKRYYGTVVAYDATNLLWRVKYDKTVASTEDEAEASSEDEDEASTEDEDKASTEDEDEASTEDEDCKDSNNNFNFDQLLYGLCFNVTEEHQEIYIPFPPAVPPTREVDLSEVVEVQSGGSGEEDLHEFLQSVFGSGSSPTIVPAPSGGNLLMLNEASPLVDDLDDTSDEFPEVSSLTPPTVTLPTLNEVSVDEAVMMVMTPPPQRTNDQVPEQLDDTSGEFPEVSLPTPSTVMMVMTPPPQDTNDQVRDQADDTSGELPEVASPTVMMVMTPPPQGTNVQVQDQLDDTAGELPEVSSPTAMMVMTPPPQDTNDQVRDQSDGKVTSLIKRTANLTLDSPPPYYVE